MREGRSEKQILICESYPGIQKAFELMLGNRYELIFTSDPAQIKPFLSNHSIFLVLWDLDLPPVPLHPLQERAKAIRSGKILEILGALKSVRKDYPELPIVLISGEFEYDFQVAAIQQCGLVRFFTKPWKSSEEVVEKVQVLLGDKKSSIRRWVLKIPLIEPNV